MKIAMQSILTGALAFAFVPAASAQDASVETVSATTEAPQKTKKPERITDRKHPDYIRCRSEPIIGSLSRKRRVCMTNREWTEAARQGSRNSRQFIEDMQVGESSSN